MNAKQSSELPVISCEERVIKMRAKNWLEQICKEHPNKLLFVSAMADATKVPTVGNFSHK